MLPDLLLVGKSFWRKKKNGVPSHQLVVFQVKYSEYSNGATCCLLLGIAKFQSKPFVLLEFDMFHIPFEIRIYLVLKFRWPNPRILLHLNLSRKQRIVNHGASPWDCYSDNNLAVEKGCLTERAEVLQENHETSWDLKSWTHVFNTFFEETGHASNYESCI